jgi:uncharacterized damage-inducible protein DinB
MTTLDWIRKLWKHAAAADAALLAVLREEEGTADARRELAHVVGAEAVWLARLEGRAPASAVWPDAAAAAIDQNIEATHRAFDAYLSRLADAYLDAAVTYTNSAGRTFTDTAGDILLHVALHGQYHRGKINLLLRQGGRTPVPADYIAFVRGAPAATEASARDGARTTSPPRR